jgi:hypothetical protein
LLLGALLLGLTIEYAGATVEPYPVRRGVAVERPNESAVAPDLPLRTNPHVSLALPDSLLQGSSGDTIMVPVRVTIEEGTRMYSDRTYDLTFAPVPLSVKVGGGTHLTLAGPVNADAPPMIGNDEHFDAELEYWVGTVLFNVPVLVQGTAGQTYQGSVAIEFMTCDDKACHPPEVVRLPFTVVTAKAAR